MHIGHPKYYIVYNALNMNITRITTALDYILLSWLFSNELAMYALLYHKNIFRNKRNRNNFTSSHALLTSKTKNIANIFSLWIASTQIMMNISTFCFSDWLVFHKIKFKLEKTQTANSQLIPLWCILNIKNIIFQVMLMVLVDVPCTTRKELSRLSKEKKMKMDRVSTTLSAKLSFSPCDPTQNSKDII